jgi:hypothetical protein
MAEEIQMNMTAPPQAQRDVFGRTMVELVER